MFFYELVVAFLSIPLCLPRNICIICFSPLKDCLCFLTILYLLPSPRVLSCFVFLSCESLEKILSFPLTFPPSSLPYGSPLSALLSTFSFLCSFWHPIWNILSLSPLVVLEPSILALMKRVTKQKQLVMYPMTKTLHFYRIISHIHGTKLQLSTNVRYWILCRKTLNTNEVPWTPGTESPPHLPALVSCSFHSALIMEFFTFQVTLN